MAAALAYATETISQPRTLEDTLDAVVHAARTSLPRFGHVSVSERHRSGTIETRAGTDQLVWELDALQYDLDEGPCVQALEHEPVVVVEHLRHEQRWPRYIPAAAARGVRSQMGVRLFSDGRHVGGLNLYSTDHDEVDLDTAATARLLATHVAVVLGHARHEHELNQALQSRKVIGQAVGILMERYRIDPDRAFQFLVRASSAGNIKLRDVAEEIVTTSIEQYRRS
ncbi:GAF and ANTAR domain-containing protein [Nocardioides xinjiangensis]|uniref:GAF and ANTAR domain-containing protein n=1 Tax=Nocardioides xinjiangensis TaxID=2817376 RepID=UPI001B312248|nr:GAF and ANTAR domain-containing protein [Nocardioides sp. SYSU D00514]